LKNNETIVTAAFRNGYRFPQDVDEETKHNPLIVMAAVLQEGKAIRGD
jgi:hypothetical protein